MQCEKHPNNQHDLTLCNRRYKFCLDCIAEKLISMGLKDLATQEEKAKSFDIALEA